MNLHTHSEIFKVPLRHKYPSSMSTNVYIKTECINPDPDQIRANLVFSEKAVSDIEGPVICHIKSKSEKEHSAPYLKITEKETLKPITTQSRRPTHTWFTVVVNQPIVSR